MAKTTVKDNSWEATLAKLDKDFGKGTVIGAKDQKYVKEAISTGSIALDEATGIGGYPEGRIIEIWGPESSGKTTLALHAIAEGQKKYPNKKFVVIDAEHSLDKYYANSIGVDLDKLLISQPDYGEQALEVANRLLNTGEIGVMVIDSVAALVPKSEIEGQIGDANVGKQARMMSQALRMLTGVTEKTGAILIFINQIRDKIGVMWGSPENTTGGNALKFYASMRLDIRKIATNKEGKGEDEESVSNTVRVKIKKNKVAAPFTEAVFNINFGEGISRLNEILDIAVERGIIEKSGSWFTYKGDSIGQGSDKVIQLFRDNPELADEIESKICHKEEVVEIVTEVLTENIPLRK